MTTKNKNILLCSTIILLIIALIVTILVFSLTPIGLVNADKIIVNDYLNSNYTITIPVKMKKGYYTPYSNTFSSNLSTLELCELASKYDNNVKYEVKNDKAYLYKMKNDKIVARVALFKHDYVGNNLNYTANNMAVEGIIFPIHLTENFFGNKIILNETEYNWYAVSFMTMDDMITWLNSIGIYELDVDVNAQTIICKNKVSNKNIAKIGFEGNLIGVKSIGG